MTAQKATLVGGPGDGVVVDVTTPRVLWTIARPVPGGMSREDHEYVLCAYAPEFGAAECWRYVYAPLTRTLPTT